MERTLQQPKTGLGSTAETNRLLGGRFFNETTGAPVDINKMTDIQNQNLANASPATFDQFANRAGWPTISSETLASTPNPAQLPPAPAPKYQPAPIVTEPPQPPATPAPEKSALKTIQEQVLGLGEKLLGKGEATLRAQEEAQIAAKRESQVKSYKAYSDAKRDLETQVQALQGQGLTDVQRSAREREIRRIGNANIANLAIQAQYDQDLLTAAEKTVKEKIDAQFTPMTEYVDFLTKASSMLSNDLTESEKFALQTKINKTTKDVDSLTGVAKDLQTNMVANGAASRLGEIDKIVEDYQSGKLTAQQAQTKMIQIAGSAGVKPGTKSGTSGVGLGVLTSLPLSTQSRIEARAKDFASSDITKKYNATVDAINIVNGIDPASKNPSDHQAIVYAFAKSLDPESVVREGEYETIKKYAQSATKRYGKEITNAINGTGFLSEDAIKNIQTTMNNNLKSRTPQYENLKSETARVINNWAGGRDVAGEILYDFSAGATTENPFSEALGGSVYNSATGTFNIPQP